MIGSMLQSGKGSPGNSSTILSPSGGARAGFRRTPSSHRPRWRRMRVETEVFPEGVDGHDYAGTTACEANGARAERRILKGCQGCSGGVARDRESTRPAMRRRLSYKTQLPISPHLLRFEPLGVGVYAFGSQILYLRQTWQLHFLGFWFAILNNF